MVRHPDEHITFPAPPDPGTSLRLPGSLLRISVASAVLAAAIVSAGPGRFARPGATCSTSTSAEVSAVLDEIASLQASEAAIRRRLAGPGVIIPPDLETYR